MVMFNVRRAADTLALVDSSGLILLNSGASSSTW